MLGLAAESALAWRGMGPRSGAQLGAPCGGGMGRSQAWSEEKQQTIEGKIKDVQVVQNCMGDRDVMQLKVLSGSNEYFVHLGPRKIVNDRTFPFALGDDVKITGVLFEANAGRTIVASAIENRGTKYVLRDQYGRPTWSVARQPGTADRETGKLTH
jgi:hypothetical protein